MSWQQTQCTRGIARLVGEKCAAIFAKFPVFFPVIGNSAGEKGWHWTATTANGVV
jgi:hypothetical protein